MVLSLTKQIVKTNADGEMLCKSGDRYTDGLAAGEFEFVPYLALLNLPLGFSDLLHCHFIE